MPINHTTISPSYQLTMELSRLAQIAAGAQALNHHNLKKQAEEAYNKLVDSYNSQLPPDKPKGFWRQFADNLTFRDLDTTVVRRLEHLSSSSEYQSWVDLFSKMSPFDISKALNDIIERRF